MKRLLLLIALFTLIEYAEAQPVPLDFLRASIRHRVARIDTIMLVSTDGVFPSYIYTDVNGNIVLWDAVSGVQVLSDLIGGGGGSSAFSALSSGTNTTATMTVGTGGSILYSGSGIIDATRFLGVTSVDATEFGYLNGVTSAIQTQLDAKALATRSIATQYSLTGGGNLTGDRTLNLVGDVASPGNSKLYGTNSSGTRGWYDIPAGVISDVAFGVSWNGVTTDGPSKNAVYDYVSTLMLASAFAESAAVHSIGVSFDEQQITFGIGTDSLDGDANLTWTKTTNANTLNIGAGTSPGEIHVFEGSATGTDYTAIKASASIATPNTLTLPTTTGTLALTTNPAQSFQNAATDATLTAAGDISFNTTDEQLSMHSAADGEISGEASIPLLFTRSWTFDPKAVCDGAIDRLFLMRLADEAPEGIIIDEWFISFEADPTTEIDADLKYADAMIGVANAAVVDALDTTTGAATEDTDANINGGAAIPAGKVMYIEFGTAYTEANHQIMFTMTWHYEED